MPTAREDEVCPHSVREIDFHSLSLRKRGEGRGEGPAFASSNASQRSRHQRQASDASPSRVSSHHCACIEVRFTDFDDGENQACDAVSTITLLAYWSACVMSSSSTSGKSRRMACRSGYVATMSSSRRTVRRRSRMHGWPFNLRGSDVMRVSCMASTVTRRRLGRRSGEGHAACRS